MNKQFFWVKLFHVLRNTFSIIGIISCLSLIFYFLILNHIPIKDLKEVSRLASPNKKYDAVILVDIPLFYSNLSPVVTLSIVPFGEKVTAESKSYKCSNYSATLLSLNDIHWNNNNELIINRISNNKVFHFNPEYYDYKNQNIHEHISLYLKNY